MAAAVAVVVITDRGGGGGVFRVDAWESAYLVALVGSASDLSLHKDRMAPFPCTPPPPAPLAGHAT